MISQGNKDERKIYIHRHTLLQPRKPGFFPTGDLMLRRAYVNSRSCMRGSHHFYFTTNIHINTVQPSLKFKEPSYLISLSYISSCLLCIFFPFHTFIFLNITPLLFKGGQTFLLTPLPFSCYRSWSKFIFFSTLDFINFKNRTLSKLAAILFIYLREQFSDGNNFSSVSRQNNYVYLKPGNHKTASHVWRFSGKQLKNCCSTCSVTLPTS